MDELSDKNYVIIDHFLGNDSYQTVKKFLLSKLPEFQLAGIGTLDKNTIDKGTRGDLTYWLSKSRDTEPETFWGLVDEMLNIFNRHCFMSLMG